MKSSMADSQKIMRTVLIATKDTAIFFLPAVPVYFISLCEEDNLLIKYNTKGAVPIVL